MRQRTGSLYSEFTNKGRSSARYVRGCKPVYCFRWVAEITIHGKRHRFRSTSYYNCRAWLNDMIEKAGPIETFCERQKRTLPLASRDSSGESAKQNFTQREKPANFRQPTKKEKK